MFSNLTPTPESSAIEPRIAVVDAVGLGYRGAVATVQLTLRAVLVRGLSLVTTLVLARLLSPVDFGVFAIVSFTIWLFMMLGDLGLGAALVQSEQEPTHDQLAAVWTSQKVLAAVCIAAVWMAAPLVSWSVPGLPADTPWMLRILSLGLIPVSLRTLPSVMLERQMRFGPLAASEVLAQTAFCATAISLAAFGFGAWSFVLAALVQFSVGAAIVNVAWGRPPGLRFSIWGLKGLIGFGVEYQLAAMLVWLRDAPVPLIGALILGPLAAGLLDLAWAIGAAAAMIDETIGRVAFPAFSRLQGRRADQSRAVELAISLTALVSVPTQLWLAAVAPILIPLLFGPQWTLAVAPVQGVCIAMIFRFPTRYLRQIAFANGESRLGLKLAAASSALALAPFVPALWWLGLPGAGAAFVVGSVGAFVLSAIVCARLASISWLRFGRFIAVGLVAAVPVHLIALAISGAAGLLVSTAVFVALYATFVFFRERELAGLAIHYLREGAGRGARETGSG